MAEDDENPPKTEDDGCHEGESESQPSPPVDKTKPEASRLREPRLTRSLSLAVPANDRTVESGKKTETRSVRPRFSAPPGGDLFAGRRRTPPRPPEPAFPSGARSAGTALPADDPVPAESPRRLSEATPPILPPGAKRPEPSPPDSDEPIRFAKPRPDNDFENGSKPPRPHKLCDPALPMPSAEMSATEKTTAPRPAAPEARAPQSDAQRPPAAPIPHPRARCDGTARPDKPKPVLVAKNEGLEVHSLGKQFKKRPVLRDVSLRVQRGEAVGLLGPNGAGKTTCFYIVTGLIPADYGQIVLDGVDITGLPMYRRSRLGIGYLPQESSIFRGLSVEQNIMAVLELIEENREKQGTTLEALLAEFSISHLRRTPAVALSGGERRRLEIARALASQPNFILLDEPLAGIDPIAVRDIRELVSHLKDRGIGVLITDHNVRETLDIVDRVYILHDGGVLMEGPPDEIVANHEVRRVYLGDRFSL